MLFFLSIQQFPQPVYFFIFLLPYFFNSSCHNILNCLLLVNNFFQLTNLLLILVFLISNFPFVGIHFPFYNIFIPLLGVLNVWNSAFFCFLVLAFPFFDLAVKLNFFCGPIFAFALLFLHLYFHELVLRSHITILLFSLLEIGDQVWILF